MFTLKSFSQGGEGGRARRRRFRPALVFFTMTPSYFMVPAPVPAVFSLSRKLVNHLRGGVNEIWGGMARTRPPRTQWKGEQAFKSYGPWRSEGTLPSSIRIALPSAKWDTLGQGQAFHGSQSEASCAVWELWQEAFSGLLVGQGVTHVRAPFDKAANPEQAGKGSVKEPREESPRSTSLFFLGCCAWLALSGVTEFLKVWSQTACQNVSGEIKTQFDRVWQDM